MLRHAHRHRGALLYEPYRYLLAPNNSGSMNDGYEINEVFDPLDNGDCLSWMGRVLVRGCGMYFINR
jgi:hypothetical protein